MNYKIAVLTGDWTTEIMSEFLHGVDRYAKQGGVSVFVFNCCGGLDKGSPNYLGEYNIFTLPDWKDFDGVLLQGNLLMSDEIRQKVWKEVHESGIPAIVADYPLTDCAFMGVDNYQAMCEIVEHLIVKHNCRIIHFMSGPEWHLENQKRLQAYRDTMDKYSLPYDDTMIHPGDFLIGSGIRAAEIIASQKGIPDAVVCANDVMALGVCEGLKAHGIRVPGDVRVTGFDGIQSAQDYSPSITTIIRNHNAQGYDAMRNILLKIRGFDVPFYTNSEYVLNTTESCGCPAPVDESDRSLRIRHFHEDFYRNDYLRKQEILHNRMLEAMDMKEIVRALKENEDMFDCKGIDVCINRDFLDKARISEREYRDIGYPDEFYLMSESERLMTKKELLMYFSERTENGDIAIFYPLHFKQRCFGFFVLIGYSQAIDRELMRSTLTLIGLSIENVRTKKVLHDYNEKLNRLYVQDSMTGLYNRFGYERFGEELFTINRDRKSPMLLVFFDMDHLKYINDHFGHELGDAAIIAIAEIIKKCCEGDQIAVRYGGDEFLILGSCTSEEDEKRFRGKIMKEIDDYNDLRSISFKLSLSIGFCYSEPSDEKSLGECVRIADQRMYEEKIRRKEERREKAGE